MIQWATPLSSSIILGKCLLLNSSGCHLLICSDFTQSLFVLTLLFSGQYHLANEYAWIVNFLISSALFGRLTIGQGVSHRNTANALRYFHCVSCGWYSSFSDNVVFMLFAACCVPVLCLLGLLLRLFAIHTRGTSQCD